jgi:hypothetical protein
MNESRLPSIEDMNDELLRSFSERSFSSTSELQETARLQIEPMANKPISINFVLFI